MTRSISGRRRSGPARAASRAGGRLTRRSVVAGLAALVAAPGLVRAAGTRLPELVLWGPPAGPSITLAHAVASGKLSGIAEKTSLRVWRNPDEMRAGLTSGTMQVTVMPTTTAANLHTRGLGIHLVNVMTDGLLHIVSADAGLDSLPALRGKTLAVPFRNDTSDIVLGRLLGHHGLAAGADITIETSGTPTEAVQLLLAGRVDAALVPEPAATAAIVRGAQADKSIRRVIDIQRAWGEMTGLPPALPQAGLAVTAAFRAGHEALVDALHTALGEAAAAVRADPERAAGDAAPALELPAPVIARSVPFSNLVARRASEARPSLEAMFATVAEANPAIIGGRLPDPAFYL